jgi:alpha-tubulin suppressor-like RCC1 family protein
MKRKLPLRLVPLIITLSLAAVPVPTAPASAQAPIATATTGPGFTSLSPSRLLDTRSGLGAPKAPVGAGRSIDVQVTGRGGVPGSGVHAVVLNVAAIATSSTYVTVYAGGATRPTASNLNVAPGQTVANLVIVTVSSAGKITLYNHVGSVQLVADVSGWYATGGYYTGLNPVRLLDTRTGLGAPKAPVGPGSSISLQVAGRGLVPASGAVAVALNVAGTTPTRSTYVTAYPAGDARPTASNLNLDPGQTAAVLVMAKLGAGGKVTLFNHAGSTHLVADIAGWFAPSGQYTPLSPRRLLDTRSKDSSYIGGLPAHASGVVFVSGCEWSSTGVGVPASAAAVVLSVAAVTPRSAGYLTAYPYGTSQPNASTLNYAVGRTVANLVIAKMGSSGGIALYNSGDYTQIVVDVLGWFSATNEPGAIDHTAWSWGGGQSGQLGNAVTPADSSTPVRVAIPGEVTAVAGGGSTGYAVTASGIAWSWGNGDSGRLGDGTTFRSTCSPSPVPGLSEVVGIAAGSATGYALKSDGTVWSWGSGTHGELGNGTKIASLAPVRVTGLSGVTAVASRGINGYALKSDGTVWSWGYGLHGGLGNGSTSDSLVPVQVTGLSDVVALAAGSASAYALKSDGTVWAWGYGLHGALGDGQNTTRTTPVQVSGLAGVTDIKASGSGGFAVRRDGTLWVWGQGVYGELGNGTTGEAPVPIPVTGVTEVTAVGATNHTVVATTASGTTWAWGRGTAGELGNGTSPDDSTTPVQVSGLSGVKAIAGGGATVYVIGNLGLL